MKRRDPGPSVRRRDDPVVGGSRASGLVSAFAIVVPASVVVAVGISLMLVLDLQPGAGRQRAAVPAPAVVAENPAVALPEYLTNAPPKTQEAYRYALESPEALEYIPCYCGCAGSGGHRNLRDCFLKDVGPDVVQFEAHGSGCGICVDIALDVKTQLAQGKSLSEARSFIDGKYSDIGPGTDTPLPPE